jgi:hypothetical protein|tara:strand:- start:2555 stop:2851 length:297 start_codon:yes stop_codon:yes gene_type:complete
VDICTAILAINSSAKVYIENEDYDRISWLENTEVISKSDIQAKQAELKTAYDALAYSRARAKTYPSWEKQLEKIFDDGIDKWKSEMIQPVKDANPKPE